MKYNTVTDSKPEHGEGESIEKLRQHLDGMYVLNKEGWGKVEAYEKLKDKLVLENEALKESNRQLAEALEPFFKLGQEVLDIMEHDQTVYEFNGAKITTQDLKKVLTIIFAEQ